MASGKARTFIHFTASIDDVIEQIRVDRRWELKGRTNLEAAQLMVALLRAWKDGLDQLRHLATNDDPAQLAEYDAAVRELCEEAGLGFDPLTPPVAAAPEVSFNVPVFHRRDGAGDVRPD